MSFYDLCVSIEMAADAHLIVCWFLCHRMNKKQQQKKQDEKNKKLDFNCLLEIIASSEASWVSKICVFFSLSFLTNITNWYELQNCQPIDHAARYFES